MASISATPTSDSFPFAVLPRIPRYPMLSSALFFACDMCALSLTVLLVLLCEHGRWDRLNLQPYFSLWPAVGVFIATFFANHLYPGVIYNAVTELRRLGGALTLSFAAVSCLFFIAGYKECPPRFILFCWLLAMPTVPLLRSVVRSLICSQAWWGVPVVVFHTGDETLEILRELKSHPEIGLRPVAVLVDSQATLSRRLLSGKAGSLADEVIPILDLRLAPALIAIGVERAMIALPAVGSEQLLKELEKFESLFPRLMIVHSSAAPYSLTVDARELAGYLAVDLRRDLLLPFPRLAKRVIDVTIVLLSAPAVILAIVALSALVRLESAGPAFYGQRRIGLGHSTFRIWKIRTMQPNGDQVLENAIAADVSLRNEWAHHRKLRRDPRVTRIGRFLRKTSLDELPQIWNVLRGEMSLVGPRPIVEDEIASYGANFALYCRVTPGLTGLWQVSGRNDVTCRDRVRLDSYYVRNWSPWLDLYILARTAKVVLTGAGAY
jgi:Undecaprenyl-phosphate galactose phosphotransferase WbaP